MLSTARERRRLEGADFEREDGVRMLSLNFEDDDDLMSERDVELSSSSLSSLFASGSIFGRVERCFFAETTIFFADPSGTVGIVAGPNDDDDDDDDDTSYTADTSSVGWTPSTLSQTTTVSTALECCVGGGILDSLLVDRYDDGGCSTCWSKVGGWNETDVDGGEGSEVEDDEEIEEEEEKEEEGEGRCCRVVVVALMLLLSAES